MAISTYGNMDLCGGLRNPAWFGEAVALGTEVLAWRWRVNGPSDNSRVLATAIGVRSVSQSNILKLDSIGLRVDVGLMEGKAESLLAFWWRLVMVGVINQKKEFRRKGGFGENDQLLFHPLKSDLSGPWTAVSSVGEQIGEH